jgi:uncharacterized protein (TIGR02391 family)
VHWDDLEILRGINRLEQTEPASLNNGLWLMEKVAGGQVPEHQRHMAFVRELLLAAESGYLVFEDNQGGWQPVEPGSQPHLWLQRIQDIHLTNAGRDRARGRVVVQEPPDPEEDDGRQIAYTTLEEIGRSIAEAYSGSQIPVFLVDSGIPEEKVPPFEETKHEYVASLLLALLEHGAASRREVRQFLGEWLSDLLVTGPRPDVKRRVLAQLSRQGWHLKENRLVIGPRKAMPDTEEPATSREAQYVALHAAVRQAAGKYLDSENLEVAVFEAMKAVTNRVKSMTGIDDEDGYRLMSKVFSEQKPALELADCSTTTGRSVQGGYRGLFQGAVQAIRNPAAHEPLNPLTAEEAMELLALASLLNRALDNAAPPGGAHRG